MIKLVYVITRRADLSPAQFYEHWLKSHAPLVAQQAKSLHLRKYVQSHLVDDPANEGMRAVRGMLPPVDGITEVWWDSLDDLVAAYETPEGAASGRILSEDEARFIDFAKSQVFLTEEHLIFDHTDGKGPGPDALKVTYLLTRRHGLYQEDCHRTWLADHGPLVASFAGVLHMKKYVQSHTIAPDWNADVQAAGFAAPLDGITEVWIDSRADLERGGETEAGRNASMALVEDERRFVEMGASRCFLTKEHLIFDHTAE
ncbi:MAG: EthD domain-containing protein [Rhizomicrobium sp.]